MKESTHDNNEVEVARINAEGTITASKISFKAKIIVALISLVTTIVGIFLGGIIESNKGQVIINQTFYGIIDDEGNSDITLEEIKQNYIQLQSDYDQLQSQNNYLLGENTKLSSELDESKNRSIGRAA